MDLKGSRYTGGSVQESRLFGGRVSPFGNLRIKGCLVPPRSVSRTYRVLHRSSMPRHPLYALMKNLFFNGKATTKALNKFLSYNLKIQFLSSKH